MEVCFPAVYDVQPDEPAPPQLLDLTQQLLLGSDEEEEEEEENLELQSTSIDRDGTHRTEAAFWAAGVDAIGTMFGMPSKLDAKAGSNYVT